MNELTNFSYGDGKASQLRKSFYDLPEEQVESSQIDDLEKGVKKGSKLDTAHLVLKDVPMADGRMEKRWVDPTKGDAVHIPRGSKVNFSHSGQDMSGHVGRVAPNGQYQIHMENGSSFHKEPHTVSLADGHSGDNEESKPAPKKEEDKGADGSKIDPDLLADMRDFNKMKKRSTNELQGMYNNPDIPHDIKDNIARIIPSREGGEKFIATHKGKVHGKTLDEHAANASTAQLKAAAADTSAPPELSAAAKAALAVKEPKSAQSNNSGGPSKSVFHKFKEKKELDKKGLDLDDPEMKEMYEAAKDFTLKDLEEIQENEKLSDKENLVIEHLMKEKNYTPPGERIENYDHALRQVVDAPRANLFVYGKGGVGKTYNAKKIMEQKYGKNAEYDPKDHVVGDSDYKYVFPDKVTASALYEMLFAHNGKTLVFDDADGILKDPDIVNMLKKAMDTSDSRIGKSVKGGKPLMYYDPKSEEEIQVPNSFKFTGKIIFISNKPKSFFTQDEDRRALLSRGKSMELQFTNHETKDLIKDKILPAVKNNPDWKTLGNTLPREENGDLKKDTPEFKQFGKDADKVFSYIEDHIDEIPDSKLNGRMMENLYQSMKYAEKYNATVKGGKPLDVDKYLKDQLLKGEEDVLSVMKENDLIKGGTGSGPKKKEEQDHENEGEEDMDDEDLENSGGDDDDEDNDDDDMEKAFSELGFTDEIEKALSPDEIKANYKAGLSAHGGKTCPKCDHDQVFDNKCKNCGYEDEVSKAFEDLFNVDSKKKDELNKGGAGAGSGRKKYSSDEEEHDAMMKLDASKSAHRDKLSRYRKDLMSAHAVYHGTSEGDKFHKRFVEVCDKIDLKKGVEDNIIKGGEGSKGGTVIGHTKSGKAIYAEPLHISHKKFTAEDHKDAAKLHQSIAASYGNNPMTVALKNKHKDNTYTHNRIAEDGHPDIWKS